MLESLLLTLLLLSADLQRDLVDVLVLTGSVEERLGQVYADLQDGSLRLEMSLGLT